MKAVNKKIQFIFDMGLNICAVGFPVAMLQLVVYPYISRRIDADSYGLMITMYSVWMVVSNSLGNVLNNIRLLYEKEYEDKHIIGDFNILFRCWAFINLVVILVFTIYYAKRISVMDTVFSVLIASALFLKAYTEVGFRLKLNYKAILMNGLLQGVGFLVGVLAFILTGIWQFIFLFGFSFSALYSVARTKLLQEPFVKTCLYRKVSKASMQYAAATFSNSMMGYADKMVLYPLMGGHVVSVYYTATILGKIISMLTGPITSVVLSYISRWDKKRRDSFSKILLLGIVLAAAGYFITLIISRPVITFLFPQWVKNVMKLLPFTTATIVLQTLNAFLNPFVLKFYDIKWQVVINFASLFVYFSGALVLWYHFGIIGFCIGTIGGQIVKTIIVIALHINRKLSNEELN